MIVVCPQTCTLRLRTYVPAVSTTEWVYVPAAEYSVAPPLFTPIVVPTARGPPVNNMFYTARTGMVNARSVDRFSCGVE